MVGRGQEHAGVDATRLVPCPASPDAQDRGRTSQAECALARPGRDGGSYGGETDGAGFA